MDRETCLQKMSVRQQQRLNAGMPDEKEEGFQQDMNLNKEQRDVNSPIPMIQQPAVHDHDCHPFLTNSCTNIEMFSRFLVSSPQHEICLVIQ